MEAIDSLSSGATVTESELLSWLLSGERVQEGRGLEFERLLDQTRRA